MAPPVGTLRVGRYFAALIVLLGLLYLVVFFPGTRHTPKLGIDLVGGKRVIFTALTPKGAASPTSDQMSQARQIIEDRVNGQGVTGATVQVQGGDQLVVLIPGGTQADVQQLGQAAVLNFRGVMAPAQVVTCSNKASAQPLSVPSSTSSATSSAAPSSGATSSAATSATTRSASSNSGTASAGPNVAADRPLAAPAASTAPTTAASSRAASSAASSAAASSGAASSGAASSAAASSAAASSGAASSAASSGAASSSASTAATKCSADPLALLFKADPGLSKVMPNAESCPSPGLAGGTTCRAYSSLSTTRQQELAAALQNYKCSAAQSELDLSTRYYIACDTSSTADYAYLLGHVVVPGTSISSASSVAPSTSGTGGNTDWTVSLNLGGSGADNWNAWTGKYHTSQTSVSPVQTSTTAPCGAAATDALPCSDFVAFTLDGQIVSAPVTNAVLFKQTQISGGFTETTANDLAKELNFGKLPLTFRADSVQSVSATLGTTQLKAAFLAGGIGLALVVLYSLLYYRGLGLVTIASLLVSAGFTYAMLVILGTQIGFTLDLAGIAGFIVALGITADSFVVFFERIKDEVHEGRSMRVAVPRAWVRARRTILSADTVSFLAAAILYYFASADVKGFAFTLGLSTILDLIVVFLFTHPIVSLLSRSRAFGSPRFTGLNSVRAGGAEPDEPAVRQRPARTAAAQRRASSGDGAASKVSTRKGSAVAVADHPDDIDDETPDAAGSDTTDSDTTGSDTTGSDTIDSATTDPVTDSDTTDSAGAGPDDPTRGSASSRSRGTAAERAAARRARLRAQGDNGLDGGENA